MNKFCIGIASLAAVVATQASAQNVAVNAPSPFAPALSWTGCYVGGNLGGAWGYDHDNWNSNGAFGSPAFLDAVGSNNTNGVGIIGGGQVGCNYQFKSFAVGIEGDFDGTSFGGSRGLTETSPTGSVDTFNSKFTQNWLSTIRGRLGASIDQWLLYVTGGLAIANISTSDSVFFGATASTNAGSATSSRAGGVAGAGIERYIGKSWSVKAEYLYVDVKGPGPTLTNQAFAGSLIGTTHDLRENIVRLGVDWYFNGPITAKN